MYTNIFCPQKLVHKKIITFLYPHKFCPHKLRPLNRVQQKKSLIPFSLSNRHNTFSIWIIFKQTTQILDKLTSNKSFVYNNMFTNSHSYTTIIVRACP